MALNQLSNGRWQARYNAPDGKKPSRTFDTKAEGQHWLSEQRRAVRASTYVDPKLARSTTVGGLWKDWRKVLRERGARGTKPVKPKTLADYDYWAAMILEEWKHTPLANVTRQSVEDWAAGLKAKRGGPASAHARTRASKLFERMLDYAAADGRIVRNPVKDRAGRGLPSPRVEPSRSQVRLTMPQLVRLAAVCGDDGLMVLLAGTTGLRFGEVSSLRVRHLDLSGDASVFVDRDVSKTDMERAVPVPGVVAAALTARVAGLDDDGLVFPAPKGGTIDRHNFEARVYRPAAGAAGGCVRLLARALGVHHGRSRIVRNGRAESVAVVSAPMIEAMRSWQDTHDLSVSDVTTSELWESLAHEQADEEVARSLVSLSRTVVGIGDADFPTPTFHQLRHTAVSLAIGAGANIKVVQMMAGHKSAAMTLDVYADLFDEHAHEASRALDGRLRETPGLSALLS